MEVVRTLFSTLDESLFFTTLARFLRRRLGANRADAWVASRREGARLVCRNGRPAARAAGRGGEAPRRVLSVLSSGRPYVCNEPARDPLYGASGGPASGEPAKELVVPVSHEGKALGTVNLGRSAPGGGFSAEDAGKAMLLLSQFQGPLANMEAWLGQRELNEELASRMESEGATPSVPSPIHVDEPILGGSDALKAALVLADRAASLPGEPVLIEGERGTGKSMVARRIRGRSARRGRPYAAIDCASMDGDGATALFGAGGGWRRGLLETLDGGVLLLRNVDGLDPEAQRKLAGWMGSGRARRERSRESFQSDVRVLSTCQGDLDGLVAKGRFRRDLRHALGAVVVPVPPLRERGPDRRILARHFLRKALGPGAPRKDLSRRALEALEAYSWPGNVSELKGVMRAAADASGAAGRVEASHLGLDMLKALEAGRRKEEDALCGMTLEEIQRRHIQRILDHSRGNKTKTAQTLGITIKTLYNKLYSYGISFSE